MPFEFIVILTVLLGLYLIGALERSVRRAARDRARAKRARELAAWASQASLTYEADGQALLLEPFAALPLFHVGRKPRIINVVAGVWQGLDLRCFDFRHETTGKNRKDIDLTVAVFRATGASFTEFSLTPHHWLMFLAFLEQSFVRFPDDRAFSRAYELRAVDHDAARKLFRSALRLYLATHRGFRIEGNGEWVVCCRSWHLCRPSELGAFLDQARAFHDVLLGGRPSGPRRRSAKSEDQGG